MKKKIIVLGFQRTGTNLIKEFYYKYLDYKKKSTIKIKHKQIYSGLRRDDIFEYKNNNFYIFQIWKKKKYKRISKTEIKKKYILSTHYYNNKLFKLFDEFNFIITIRDPIHTITSMVNYVTKKNILLFNPEYKIKNNFELIKKKELIEAYINSYHLFYKNIINLKKNKFILIDYKKSEEKLAKINDMNIKRIKSKASNLHATINSSYIKRYLANNYNFEKCLKVYNKILSINK
jgi:hypothetical protein